MVANAYSGAKDSVDGRAFSCTGEAHKNNLHGISGNSEVEVLCFVERSLHLERAKPVVCVRVCVRVRVRHQQTTVKRVHKKLPQKCKL